MINTPNGSFSGDTPFFNRPWVWGYDGIQTYQDPNTGSVSMMRAENPVISVQNYTYVR